MVVQRSTCHFGIARAPSPCMARAKPGLPTEHSAISRLCKVLKAAALSWCSPIWLLTELPWMRKPSVFPRVSHVCLHRININVTTSFFALGQNTMNNANLTMLPLCISSIGDGAFGCACVVSASDVFAGDVVCAVFSLVGVQAARPWCTSPRRCLTPTPPSATTAT